MQTVLTTPTFERHARAAGLDDEEVAAIASYLAAHPVSGDLIVGAGGARKLRFARQGSGDGEEMMSSFGRDLIQSAREALVIAKGEAEPSRAFVPPPVDVAAIRKKTGLSQDRFARRYGFSPSAVRDWEQRRRTPEPAARTLLIVIDREPQAVDRALRIG